MCRYALFRSLDWSAYTLIHLFPRCSSLSVGTLSFVFDDNYNKALFGLEALFPGCQLYMFQNRERFFDEKDSEELAIALSGVWVVIFLVSPRIVDLSKAWDHSAS